MVYYYRHVKLLCKYHFYQFPSLLYLDGTYRKQIIAIRLQCNQWFGLVLWLFGFWPFLTLKSQLKQISPHEQDTYLNWYPDKSDGKYSLHLLVRAYVKVLFQLSLIFQIMCGYFGYVNWYSNNSMYIINIF